MPDGTGNPGIDSDIIIEGSDAFRLLLLDNSPPPPPTLTLKHKTIGSRQGEEDFRLLLNRALVARPVSVSLRVATVVLHMAPACPQRKDGTFTEVEEAALAVRPRLCWFHTGVFTGP